MKKLFVLCALLSGIAACRAQVKYQGHLGVGYSVGIGKTGQNFVNAETVHGVRVNPYLFGGVGAGFNYYHADETFNSHYFANVRGYLLDKPVTPFLSMALGYGLVAGGGGLYTSPAVGVSCRVGSHYALAFSTGLQTQGYVAGRVKWTNKYLFVRLELMF